MLATFSAQGQTEFSDSISVVTAFDSTLNDSLIDDSTKTLDSTAKVKQMAVGKDLETTVNYNARDSILMDMINRKAYLYGDAYVDYGKITLEANYIEIDWVKSEVFARGMPDSVGGDTVGLPLFKEGEDKFVSKEKGVLPNCL